MAVSLALQATMKKQGERSTSCFEEKCLYIHAFFIRAIVAISFVGNATPNY
jgi:hypothetical protein